MNWKAMIPIAAIAVVFLSVLNGCSLQEIIENNEKVDVPASVQDGGPAVLSLPDARTDFEEKAQGMNLYQNRITASEIRAGQRMNTLNSVLNFGLSAAESQGLMLPVGMAAFLAGWLGLKRPGDKTQPEADALWDEATKTTVDLMRRGKEEING